MKHQWSFIFRIDHVLMILAVLAMLFGWYKTGLAIMIFVLILFTV